MIIDNIFNYITWNIPIDIGCGDIGQDFILMVKVIEFLYFSVRGRTIFLK